MKKKKLDEKCPRPSLLPLTTSPKASIVKKYFKGLGVVGVIEEFRVESFSQLRVSEILSFFVEFFYISRSSFTRGHSQGHRMCLVRRAVNTVGED